MAGRAARRIIKATIESKGMNINDDEGEKDSSAISMGAISEIGNEESQSDNEGSKVKNTSSFSYSILMGMNDDESSNEEEEEKESESKQNDAHLKQETLNKKKSSKKKKKSKSKSRNVPLNGNDEDVEDVSKVNKKGKQSQNVKAKNEEDLDMILKELDIDISEQKTISDRKRDDVKDTDNKFSLLNVDTRFTRAEEELKRIFGSKIVAEMERESIPAAGSNRRRQPGSVRSKNRHNTKFGNRHGNHIIISPKDWWPPMTGPFLSMQVVDSCHLDHNRICDFRFVQSQEYVNIQQKYINAVNSHDVNNIVRDVLMKHPYHVDALLSMSELYRHMGEHQTSADFLERALFSMEQSFHPHFVSTILRSDYSDISCINVKLDSEDDNNKPFFIALNTHIQSLSKRGCHRSAFELTKLLFLISTSHKCGYSGNDISLNDLLVSDDPCGALLRIDYVALRADKALWLLQFIEKFDNKILHENHYKEGDGSSHVLNNIISLRSMPNFAFSSSLARFALENDDSRKNPEDSLSSLTTSKSSSAQLEEALALFPGILLKLVEKLPIAMDNAWNYIISAPFFVSHSSNNSATLEHLQEIYVERNHILWRGKDEQEYLKAAALKVAKAADSSVGIMIGGLSLSAWKAAALVTFPPSSNNFYRHIRKRDFSDEVVNNLPAEELREILGVNNALPLGQDGNVNAPNGNILDVRDRNAVRVFFETFMPWVNVHNINDVQLNNLNIDDFIQDFVMIDENDVNPDGVEE